MADYPLPKFHFQVEWGGTQIGFTEVSGLDVAVTLGSDFGISDASGDDSGQRNSEYIFLDVSKSFDL